MAQILTKLEAILKDKYQPALTNQINTEPSPFLEKIRKVNLTNNTIRCAAPIGINGGSDEIDLLTRRVETLNKRMITLVNETIQSGGDMESNEDEFKDISEQIEQLNRRIAAIQDSLANDMSRQERLEQIQKVIEQREQNSDQYDDSIVRQMIECIKVHSDGKLTIIFGGGYEIEESLK